MNEAKMVVSRPLLDHTRITVDIRALLLLLSIAGIEGVWAHFANIELIDVSAALFLIVVPLTFGLILELTGFAQRLAQTSNYLSLWLGKIVVGSTFSYLCTTLAFPLLDATFSRIDNALGFYWLSWFEFVQAHSTLHKALALAYVSLIPQTFIAVVFFSHAARTARARELWWTTIISLLICCVVSGFLPALGAYPYHQMESPEVAEILSLRSGATQHLSVLMVKGLIAFPSFHMVGVVLLSYAYRYSKLFPLVASLNGLMMISLPTQGGHYLIDMIGGAFVAIFAIFAYHRWISGFVRGDKYCSDRCACVVSATHDSDRINDAIRVVTDRQSTASRGGA
jgi:hypothetical protein